MDCTRWRRRRRRRAGGGGGGGRQDADPSEGAPGQLGGDGPRHIGQAGAAVLRGGLPRTRASRRAACAVVLSCCRAVVHCVHCVLCVRVTNHQTRIATNASQRASNAGASNVVAHPLWLRIHCDCASNVDASIVVAHPLWMHPLLLRGPVAQSSPALNSNQPTGAPTPTKCTNSQRQPTPANPNRCTNTPTGLLRVGGLRRAVPVGDRGRRRGAGPRGALPAQAAGRRPRSRAGCGHSPVQCRPRAPS